MVDRVLRVLMPASITFDFTDKLCTLMKFKEGLKKAPVEEAVDGCW